MARGLFRFPRTLERKMKRAKQKRDEGK